MNIPERFGMMFQHLCGKLKAVSMSTKPYVCVFETRYIFCESESSDADHIRTVSPMESTFSLLENGMKCLKTVSNQSMDF